jgi:hypothetical protein
MLSPRLVAAVFALALPATAVAQGAASRADALNDEGKQLFADKRYEEAHRKFSEAARLSPEGRFFFNICFTLNFLERYAEAIAACEQVEPNGADDKLIDKTQKALASLRQKQAAQGGGGEPGGGGGGADGGGEPTGPSDPGAGGGDPAGGGGTGGPTDPDSRWVGPAPAGGVPPSDDPFVQTGAGNPDDAYKWSIGGELGALSNASVGKRNGIENYAASGFSLRLFANFLISDAARFGFQGYLGFSDLGPGDDNFFDQRLNIVDLGGALFKSFRLANHLYLTPLAGLHISVQQPETVDEGFVAVGLRLEGALGYVFGGNSEHALSAAVGLNGYGPASGSAGGFDPADFALDRASATFTVGVNYQYRFSTPFGTVPLISLE